MKKPSTRKSLFVAAYCWLFGATRKEAAQAFQISDSSYISAVIETYNDQCALSFRND